MIEQKVTTENLVGVELLWLQPTATQLVAICRVVEAGFNTASWRARRSHRLRKWEGRPYGSQQPQGVGLQRYQIIARHCVAMRLSTGECV